MPWPFCCVEHNDFFPLHSYISGPGSCILNVKHMHSTLTCFSSAWDNIFSSEACDDDGDDDSNDGYD